MMVCSLVHEGKINTKLGRIQVIQNPYAHYPDDLDVHQCRQCAYPKCLAACPVPNALVADTENGNVRRINKSECIGCQECIQASPMQAIAFTDKITTQIGDAGYQVNLRGENWPLDKA